METSPVFTVKPDTHDESTLACSEYRVIDKVNFRTVCWMTLCRDTHNRVVPARFWDWQEPFVGEIGPKTRIDGIGLWVYDWDEKLIATILVVQPDEEPVAPRTRSKRTKAFKT